MKKRDEFIPCLECSYSGLDALEGEPLYYCRLLKSSNMFVLLSEMAKHCPAPEWHGIG